MKSISKWFSKYALDELRKMGIELDDNRDYTDDDLLDLYERITEEFPYAYDEDGMPLRMGKVFEEIVDAFDEMGVI